MCKKINTKKLDSGIRVVLIFTADVGPVNVFNECILYFNLRFKIHFNIIYSKLLSGKRTFIPWRVGI